MFMFDGTDECSEVEVIVNSSRMLLTILFLISTNKYKNDNWGAFDAAVTVDM